MDDSSCIRATRTPEGSATILIRFEPGVARCTTWGEGGRWALDNAAALLGDHDNPSSFAPATQPLKDLHHRFRGMRLGAAGTITEICIPTIIEQKVTGKQARRSYRALVTRYGEPAPGPFDLMLPPQPSVLASLPYHAYHPLGIEKRRADIIRRVASEHERIDTLRDEEPDAVSRRLQDIVGIGPWTAAETVRLAMGDPDAISVGDFHLPSMVAWLLAGEPRADDARMLELLEPFRGNRARAARLVELSGVKPPAFGPRRPLRSIARI